MLKVCGLTNPENIRAVSALPVDVLGFIFYNPSPRNASVEELKDFFKNHPLPQKKAGVFVNENLEQLLDIGKTLNLDIIQLHGDETPDYCNQVKQEGYKVYKAFNLSNDFDFTILEPYLEVVDHFLFDAKGSARGGNGVSFDWSLLDFYPYDLPFLLSGGVGPDEVGALKNILSTPIFGIDVNSKVEIEPGLKDIEKIKLLTKKLNQYKHAI